MILLSHGFAGKFEEFDSVNEVAAANSTCDIQQKLNATDCHMVTLHKELTRVTEGFTQKITPCTNRDGSNLARELLRTSSSCADSTGHKL